ncbi:MAG: 8-oxoguanine deaminase [Anaerolineaceae bacterium]|nr:MAG: 8-oxoguanine deaminase [Anaerolineaceae bacterium]
MRRLLVKNIHKLITLDDERREIDDGAIFAEDGVITFVGRTDALEPRHHAEADDVLILDKHIVIPGLVNTHHHMSQSLTRVVAQTQTLFGWLTSLYPIWQNITAEMIYTSAQVAMAELILSGCTTSSDHLYLYPNDVTLDDTIRAASDVGMRFHPTRGSMSVGQSKGGLPPDDIIESDENAIIKDTMRVIETYHDNARYAMVRVGVAPCAPFNVSQDLMRESATLARSYGVRLHTHLAENASDIDYSLAQFGMRPGEYVEDIGWVGDDVWHAHCVQLDSDEIALFARTGTGVAHCPCSNMRLASGIAPVRGMLDAGVNVGLGVDGTASNDSGHLLNTARIAMLLQRINGSPDSGRMAADEMLNVATRGGAAVLGRDDIGHIAPDMAADFVAYRVDGIAFAGAQHDLKAALLFCESATVDASVINGRVIVRDGVLMTLDVPVLVERHNHFAKRLIEGDKTT